MIAKLKGVVDELKPMECILDVGGVGYRLAIPFTTYEKIQGSRDVVLHVYTLHREDMFRLYGFFSVGERELFAILLNISGIGPAMALSILSGISTENLLRAVRDGDIAMLVKVPGIGKSKAEKLVFELKRRIKKIEAFASAAPEKPSLKTEAVEALVSLGFEEKKAVASIAAIIQENESLSLESIVKSALRSLSE